VYPNGSYGYGLMLHNYRGVDVVEHAGNLDGFTCVFKMVPEQKFALIILNNGVTDMPNSTKKAFELMLPLKPEVQQKPMEMNESEMDRYTGNYSGIDQDIQQAENITSVIIKDSKLLLKGTAPEAVPLEKVGKDQFTIIMPGVSEPKYIGFISGKDGRIKYMHTGFKAYPKIES
jgi:hypothetical protein